MPTSASKGAAPRRFGLMVAAAVFAIDQLLKWTILVPLDLPTRGRIRLLPIFDLAFVPNYGVSMGFLLASTGAERWLLVALTAAISLGVLVWLWRETIRADVVALGMVLGGALGNILDRVRLGHVVDFADLHFGRWHPFLVFNVADAAITIGVALLLLRALLARRPRGPVEDIDA